ncbi:uncharacterized protein LOC121745750 [Salvia splendens]|uniref:uncharacterized protein LOC121745750 n=1 Tax=Salvia splendens TaxID=180675 RepID=UPI001C2663A0|nr:uncharacterized protein LOC121745750 [Salvia splendens]
MNRFNNNGKAVWGSSRPNSYPNGAPRRQQPVDRRNFGSSHRSQLDDEELEGRHLEEIQQDDSVSGKLDRVLDRLDKFDAWKDETDRRVGYGDPIISRETEPPSGFDDGDDLGDDGFRRGRYGDMGFNSRQSGGGFRDGMQMGRGRRGGRGRPGSCWDPPGNMQTRTRGVGFDQSQDRPTTCWDPPQRFQPHMSGYDQPDIQSPILL